MISEYSDYRLYRELYQRYHEGRDISELTRLLEPLAGTRVLDLCGGDGRLTLAALSLGAKEVTLVDSAPGMIPAELADNKLVSVIARNARYAMSDLQSKEKFFDRIVCRQAVNYWLNQETARLAASVLMPGGIFAFNTFNLKPADKPRVLQYDLEGKEFVEVSWCIGNVVHHLQIREGLTPHYTFFWWLPPELIRSILGPYFHVVEDRQGKASLYRCERK